MGLCRQVPVVLLVGLVGSLAGGCLCSMREPHYDVGVTVKARGDTVEFGLAPAFPLFEVFVARLDAEHGCWRTLWGVHATRRPRPDPTHFVYGVTPDAYARDGAAGRPESELARVEPLRPGVIYVMNNHDMFTTARAEFVLVRGPDGRLQVGAQGSVVSPNVPECDPDSGTRGS